MPLCPARQQRTILHFCMFPASSNVVETLAHKPGRFTQRGGVPDAMQRVWNAAPTGNCLLSHLWEHYTLPRFFLWGVPF